MSARRGNLFSLLTVVFIAVVGWFFIRQKSERPFEQERLVETTYGSFLVKEPVLLELIDSPVMQRLKKIHQYGVMHFIGKESQHYSRYEHSLGVWALLRRYGAKIEEQIAGLLHDASHTVFSHLGDYLYRHKSHQDSYQDSIHEWFLNQGVVPKILQKYQLSLNKVLHKSGEHRVLEQEYPDICADRLEYNLKGGILEGLITQEDVEEILQGLKFENNKWYFQTSKIAAKFSSISLYLCENKWCSADYFLVQTWAGVALRRAMDIGLVSKNEIHFSTDKKVWKCLQKTNDPVIKEMMDNMIGYNQLYTVSQDSNHDFLLHGKFRGIDPWVKQGDTFKRLTKLDRNYLKEYNRVKERIAKGLPIRLLDDRVKQTTMAERALCA